MKILCLVMWETINYIIQSLKLSFHVMYFVYCLCLWKEQGCRSFKEGNIKSRKESLYVIGTFDYSYDQKNFVMHISKEGKVHLFFNHFPFLVCSSMTLNHIVGHGHIPSFSFFMGRNL